MYEQQFSEFWVILVQLLETCCFQFEKFVFLAVFKLTKDWIENVVFLEGAYFGRRVGGWVGSASVSI